MGSRSPADGHVDSFTAKAHGHVPDGAFVVPDPNLIFNGDFKRAGLDLVLSHDGHDFVVHDYFRGDKRAAIASPDGAHLTGDVVNALTGHVQYAQAASGIAAAQVIGHVTKLSGSATAVRNGVSVILNNGDNVEKGDVVSTGGDSTLGITFIDGTVFGLSSNARMVLNEMVYDPNGSNNSSLLSLVAGTITFVAGETAKHGDMKVDTPVATMGIRGTAVLSQINFVVPAGGGDPQPQASFQVLVEPNGTTGSYILFDKVTLLPIATVNQAGQMIQISGGNVSISNALMSPDIQKLITDVFTLKFTDNNSNTKLTQNFTDSITQTGNVVFIKTDTGATATATFTHLPEPTSPGTGHDPATSTRIPGPPLRQSLDSNGNVKTAFALTEHANATGDRADTTGDTVASDTISGRITFVDQNLGDRPTVSISLGGAPNYVYKTAGEQDVTGTLSALQKQDIAATQIEIQVVADAGNSNNGSAVWTYTIPDHVFDFLAAGETLTLTYKVRVDNNFSVNPEASFIDITITITGTNDKPVITTSVPVITFEGGTSVPGGPLTSDVPTTGTLSFDDVDLTDKHTVSVALTSATLPDGTVPPGPLAAFQSAMSVVIAAGADSTGDGTGTINWSLADLPVYLADFIPKGEVLTLVYTVTLKDAQGATSQQTITVTITGTDAPAVVWIATDKPGAPSGGFWKDAANWATGTVPTINDDVIVITDQLHGLTPSYPVTIDAAAYAKSITMNDYDTTVGHRAPEVINKSALTIAGEISLKADSKLTNFTASTISVGGKAEFLDSSVLTNAGYLTLKGGGDFAGGTTITNSGTTELFAGTLKTLAGINNAGGTLKADAGTTLIVDTATISGGTVTIAGTLELDGTSVLKDGTLNNSGAVNVKGTAEFAHETVANTSGGTITVLANGWLTIDQGSTVTNTGNVTVDATGKLTVSGATISGPGTVTGNGEIDLTGAAVLSGGILNNNAAFKVSGAGNALDHETITNSTTGTIEVLANGALTIDQSSTVANTGNITVDANGKLTVNGATINGTGTVTGNGEIDLTGNAVLSGGILNNNAAFKVSGTGNALHHETITNASTGTIEVLANGALTIDQGSTIANAGNVTVDANGKLTTNGATISGGTIDGLGTIDVTGASKIDGGATLSTATVSANAQLTLDGITVSGSAITGNGGIELDNTVKLKDGASIQGGAVANTGLLEIAGAATLLNDVVTNTGTVTVDGGQTLTLSGTEISGGAVNGTGTIDVIGSSKIDQSATLSTTAVTVESGVILTLDDVTVAGTAIANHGTVKVDASSKLTLNGVSLTGGALNVSGTLNSTGTTAITNANISNNYLIEATLGALTLFATSSATSIANGGILRANGAELDINGEAIANTGTLAAINHGILKLIGMTVTDTGSGHVSVESGSTLDLQGATIDGGTVTIAGTLESTGTSAINNADITNTGTITVTSGTLTIDPAILHTITNHNLIQANGGELDISGDLIVNSADIKAVHGGTLKLASVIVTNSGGTITVDGTSKLYLTDVSINGGSLSNAGNLYGVSGSNTVSAMVTNTGAIEVQAGTLNLAGGLSGVGSVTIDNGATLELAGATAQTIAFAGGTDTLQLDKVAGQSFTGTIAGQSTKAGTFTIKGAADITTSSGDALDFTASGGTSAAPANIVLTPTGALTGAANGVAVTQNGTGDISFTATGDIKGLAGHGIWLRDSATGAGDITVNNLTGKATGTGANSVGVLVENLNSASAGGISITQLGGAVGGAYGIDATTQGNGDIAIDAGGTITGSSVYGIRARSYGSGSETVTTEAASVVTSGSSAIIAVNRANSIDASDGSTITVTTYGTINSGSGLNQSGNTPAGIQAGYTGATTGSTANTSVNGTVTISNHANITASAGYGIDVYNYGNGDVRVTSFAGTTISVSGTQSVGINASALSGGTGDVTVTLGANVTISGATSYGIRAYSIDAGDVSVTMANGDSITSGSTGIVAVNYATAIAGGLGSTISVEAHGTIHSGSTSNNDGTTPGGIIAGYKPGGTGTFSNAVKGDVTVTSDATIIADAGYGIEAFTWGAGNITVTTGATSSIAAAGTAIGAFDHGGGDVSVTNNGAATGAVGVSAIANGSGDVTIVNHGNITSTSLAGISVTQNEVGATGSTHITNTGSIVAPSAHAAIFIQENATGSAQIDNSATGTIGPAVASTVTAATYAIVETGGAITINNAGHINGNISVATATFNNELGGTWTVAGTGVFGNASSIVNHGAIDLHGASISGTGLSVENYATIDSWGTASITGTIANAGSIEVHDGALTLFGSLSGSGSVTVDAGALLKLDGTVTQTITLDGDGAHLQIDTSAFGGSIGALSTNDTIDLSTIKYGLGTSAVYVANSNPATGGVLTVTDADGNHISLNLAGADYSNAHFAGSDDGTGHTLITMTDDHVPAFTAGGVLAGGVSEQADATGDFATSDTSTPATGAIHFTDIDLTDLPTAQITGQVVTSLGADHSTNLTSSLSLDEIAALKSGLTLLPQAGLNNGTVTWSYSIADGALDFLAKDQTAKVISTITITADYGKTGTTDVTITITGKNDAPVITAETNDHSGADLLETNTELVKHGTLTVSDADATDHVTVAVDHLDIYLDDVLQTGYVGEPSSATLLNYLAVQPGSILDGTATHAAFTWDFNSGSEAFDFLAAGHTLSLRYTIVPEDSHTPAGTGNGVLTFNIAGSNDAPTLGDATLASVSGDNSDPAGSTVSDLFAGKFHDADDGASFQAVAVSADSTTSDQGVWQYEIAGSDQWIDIAGVSDTTALVLSTDTLIRFVPADGFSGTPGSLDVHALDDTYTGGISAGSPVSIDITSVGIGHGGTTPVSDQAASVSIDVTVPPDVLVANGDTLDNATPPSADAGWMLDTDNGHYYRLVTTELSWGDAKTQAESDGAYLATITSQGEQDIVQGLSVGYRAWIGGGSTDDTDGTGAHFSWLTGPESGSAFGYTHWRLDSNEPNGGLGSSTQYVHIEGVDDGANGGWNDAPGDAGGRYFIEEWGGQGGQVAFKENVGTTLTTAQLLANDTDSAGNPITVTSVGDLFGQSAHGGTVTLNGNIITYTPATDYFGSDSFAYTISDGIKTSTATVSFAVDHDGGPVINTESFQVRHNNEGNTDAITGLSVVDTDSGAATDDFRITAVTGHDPDSSVDPGTACGNLDDINSALADGVTYIPGAIPPETDQITLTVTDKTTGLFDTVHFIFNEAGDNGQGISLQGTSGKDVIFATDTNDTLTGGDAKDQFVFAPGVLFGENGQPVTDFSHTITDFTEGLDKIDLRQFSSVNSINNLTIVQQQDSHDTLVTWQQQVQPLEGAPITEHESLLLKSVIAANLKGSDFIFHIT
ncbi:cadherin-like domain-containing protein [Bradyrhizobium sp. 76]|uniref:Ig-like domain-containing protein n=1 Tax=Bradyrhizobium sp. 76 TaxID=2782680 RepID=UPI001FF9CA06|nr:cadherin-like domain-containing protein [Bradyrhizobium sp. 76]